MKKLTLPLRTFTFTYMKNHSVIPTLIIVALLASAGQAAVHASAGQAVGQISITNISNQILAPIVVATHRKGVTPIFTPGTAASNELATLAETGSPQALEVVLGTDPNVLYATHLTGVSSVIMPGETVTADIVFDFSHQAVSIASMLVSTNDGFVGYNGAMIPVRGTNSYMAHAWDAGSEANTEACTDVPGPPCGDAENERVTEGAEGVILIHPGIHGMAGVRPRYDWRGPVVEFRVTGLDHDKYP